jgi:uncharacterized membrane protein YcjF (UPF0283 family)
MNIGWQDCVVAAIVAACIVSVVVRVLRICRDAKQKKVRSCCSGCCASKHCGAADKPNAAEVECTKSKTEAHKKG